MRLRRRSQAKRFKSQNPAGQRTGMLEGMRGAMVPITAGTFVSLLALGFGYKLIASPDALAVSKAQSIAPVIHGFTAKIQPAEKPATSELDWKRTHLVVFNRKAGEINERDALTSVEVATGKKAAGIYAAGVPRRGFEGVKRYGSPSEIDSSAIVDLLDAVKKGSAEGDTILVYVTGHIGKNLFAERNRERLDHKFLPRMLGQKLSGRKIVLVSEMALCPCFADALRKSASFPAITVMSPVLTDELVHNLHFAQPLWHALDSNLDLDGDKTASLEEAFYSAMRHFRRYHPDAIGSYREGVRKIKDKSEVKNGVVMVTADWCPACKEMEPVFETTNLVLPGNRRFYLIDSTDSDSVGSLPTIYIMKDGKKVASQSGAIPLRRFLGWLSDNGALPEEFDVSVKKLYEQKKFDLLVLVSGWKEIRDGLGVVKALDMLNSMLKHPDPIIRGNTVELLALAASSLNKREVDGLLGVLYEDKDIRVRIKAAKALLIIADTAHSDLLEELKRLRDAEADDTYL